MELAQQLKKELTLRQLKEFFDLYPHQDIADIGGAGYEDSLELLGIEPTVYDLRDGFDISKAPLPRKHQTIICNNTLEHIFDPVRAAENITKSLQKDGYLFLTTVWVYDQHDYTIEGHYVPDYYRFTVIALEELFKGLEKVQCWYEPETQNNFQRVTYVGRKLR